MALACAVCYPKKSLGLYIGTSGSKCRLIGIVGVKDEAPDFNGFACRG